MARIRTIKPDFWTDEKLTECSLSARLFFVGLLNFSDDYGNQPKSPKRMKMQIFPADNIDTAELLDELEAENLIYTYEVDGEKYIHIKGFKKHQVINRPSKTGCPPPLKIKEFHGTLSESSLKEEEKEGKGNSITDGCPSDELFDEFWEAYPSRSPHQNPKKPAKQKFDAAVKRGVDPPTIIDGAKRYAAYVKSENVDKQFIKQAVTWINQECWETVIDLKATGSKW